MEPVYKISDKKEFDLIRTLNKSFADDVKDYAEKTHYANRETYFKYSDREIKSELDFLRLELSELEKISKDLENYKDVILWNIETFYPNEFESEFDYWDEIKIQSQKNIEFVKDRIIQEKLSKPEPIETKTMVKQVYNLSDLNFQLGCFYGKFFEKQYKETGKYTYNYYINTDEVSFLNTDWLAEYLTTTKIENNILFKEIAEKSLKIIELWNDSTNEDIDEQNGTLYLIAGKKKLYQSKPFESDTGQLFTVKNIADKCALIVNLITSFFPNVLESTPATTPKDYDDSVFINYESESLFREYMENHIIDPFIDVSFIFQQMKADKLIRGIKHLDFAEWLKNKGLISDKEYSKIYENRTFRALRKCTAGHRQNNYFNLKEKHIKG